MNNFIENQKVYTDGMEEYIAELKLQYKKEPEISKEIATEALIRTGVMTEDGYVKNEIVVE